jgi:hypothetical protein
LIEGTPIVLREESPEDLAAVALIDPREVLQIGLREEVLEDPVLKSRCMKLSATNAAVNVKFLSDLQQENRFIAVIVSEKTNLLILGYRITLEESLSR